MLITVQYHQH